MFHSVVSECFSLPASPEFLQGSLVCLASLLALSAPCFTLFFFWALTCSFYTESTNASSDVEGLSLTRLRQWGMEPELMATHLLPHPQEITNSMFSHWPLLIQCQVLLARNGAFHISWKWVEAHICCSLKFYWTIRISLVHLRVLLVILEYIFIEYKF